MRYIMPKRKGYNNPKREQYCHHPFDIETSTFQSLDNIKTLYIKVEFSSRQVFSCRSNSNAKVVIISESHIFLNKFF